MRLAHLPREIFDAISICLDDNDCRQLCQTSRGFMDALEDRAYRCISLDESRGSGRSLLAIAAGPRARRVRAIRYSPHDPKPVNGWKEDYGGRGRESEHNPDIKLSDESREVLASLHQLPGLEEVAVVLDHWWLGSWPSAPISFSSYAFDRYHAGRDVEPWRILLEESFSALIKSAGTFTRLLIDNLPPIPGTILTGNMPPIPPATPYCSAFDTEEWRALPNNLTSFEIFLGTASDEGMGSMTVAHQEFLATFPGAFLSHLRKVESLIIVGDEHAVIGHYQYTEPIMWRTVHLPHLKTFELQFSCIGAELVGFLLQHANTLEKICLRYCFAGEKSIWMDLIKGFIAAEPTLLLDFTIVALPLVYEYESSCEDYDSQTAESKEKAHQFLVAETCESYGTIQPIDGPFDPEMQESHVAEQWEVLQEIIQRNRSKPATTIG